MSVSCLLVPLYIRNNILTSFTLISIKVLAADLVQADVIRKRESRAKEKIKNEAIKEELRLQYIKKKAAKDLAKANAALNPADLIIKKPEFMVGSHVKSIVNTLSGTNSKESVYVEDNVIYK